MSTTKYTPLAKCQTCACNNCATSELSRLNRLNAALDSVYEIMGVGLVFFDHNNKVTHLSGLAKSRLHLPSAFILMEEDLISLCFNAVSRHEILQAIHQLRSSPVHYETKLEVLIHNVKSSIMLQKLEHSAFGLHSAGIVMLMFEPKHNDESALNEVTRIFGLTKAEARLTLAIVNGMTANEYAEMHGISINTAYSQIKDVLAKTGTRRQVELVKLVLQHSPVRDRRVQHHISLVQDNRCTAKHS